MLSDRRGTMLDMTTTTPITITALDRDEQPVGHREGTATHAPENVPALDHGLA